jgi:alpha-L-rhamnosidase
VLVASTPEILSKNRGDIWNSGKVRSCESVQVAYEGKKPESRRRYYWKVRVWDKRNDRSTWSEPALWEMGLSRGQEWKGKWIGYKSLTAPLLRKEFNISRPLKEARVYISGLGFYELSINGTKVGDHVLDPGQTDYEQRVFYVVYDVTRNLRTGNNAIGVMLGNGWFNQAAVNHGKYGWKDVVYGTPRMIFQMHLTFADGTQELVISDETWKGSSGPVLSDNLYAGERYDARLEQEGWDTPGFNDAVWGPVKQVEGPGGTLVCQNIPPIKTGERIRPVRLTSPRAGVYVYNMGQNFAGWARLKLNGVKGSAIKLRFSEWLRGDGMIDPGSTGYYATGVVQTDQYICKGGMEAWEPRFTYHGFQYVEMTGFPGTPTLENLEGIVVHTDVQKTGDFKCSDKRINKLHSTALWTELSNLYSIPTDCPHRERCGWLGDAFLTSDMTLYNFEMAAFWSKYIEDIETSRRGDIPPNIAPGRRMGGKDPDWGAAFIQLPWNLFLYYGDRSIITDHYKGMSLFMDHLQKIAKDDIVYEGIGSLFSPGRIMPVETPVEFTSTALFCFCAEAMARMAHAIGREDDRIKYRSLVQRTRTSFNNKFFDILRKTYGSVENNVIALAFGLVPEKDEKQVAGNLYREVLEIHNSHVTTGIFGSRYIYWVLGKYGYGELVRNILDLDTYPSYGYLFSRGATTFWENWGERKFEDRDTPGDDRSKCHPFQGGFDAWVYNGIAGINPDPDMPGFRHIILQPQLMNTLSYAGATFHSAYGVVSSRWQHTRDEFKWSVSIPVNAFATLCMPTTTPDSVYEGVKPAMQSEGVKFLRITDGNAVFEIGSGDYVFTIKE